MVQKLPVDNAPLSPHHASTHISQGSRTGSISVKPITQGERAFLETMRRRHSDPSKLAKIEARLEDDRKNPAFF